MKTSSATLTAALGDSVDYGNVLFDEEHTQTLNVVPTVVLLFWHVVVSLCHGDVSGNGVDTLDDVVTACLENKCYVGGSIGHLGGKKHHPCAMWFDSRINVRDLDYERILTKPIKWSLVYHGNPAAIALFELVGSNGITQSAEERGFPLFSTGQCDQPCGLYGVPVTTVGLSQLTKFISFLSEEEEDGSDGSPGTHPSDTVVNFLARLGDILKRDYELLSSGTGLRAFCEKVREYGASLTPPVSLPEYGNAIPLMLQAQLYLQAVISVRISVMDGQHRHAFVQQFFMGCSTIATTEVGLVLTWEKEKDCGTPEGAEIQKMLYLVKRHPTYHKEHFLRCVAVTKSNHQKAQLMSETLSLQSVLYHHLNWMWMMHRSFQQEHNGWDQWHETFTAYSMYHKVVDANFEKDSNDAKARATVGVANRERIAFIAKICSSEIRIAAEMEGKKFAYILCAQVDLNQGLTNVKLRCRSVFLNVDEFGDKEISWFLFLEAFCHSAGDLKYLLNWIDQCKKTKQWTGFSDVSCSFNQKNVLDLVKIVVKFTSTFVNYVASMEIRIRNHDPKNQRHGKAAARQGNHGRFPFQKYATYLVLEYIKKHSFVSGGNDRDKTSTLSELEFMNQKLKNLKKRLGPEDEMFVESVFRPLYTVWHSACATVPSTLEMFNTHPTLGLVQCSAFQDCVSHFTQTGSLTRSGRLASNVTKIMWSGENGELIEANCLASSRVHEGDSESDVEILELGTLKTVPKPKAAPKASKAKPKSGGKAGGKKGLKRGVQRPTSTPQPDPSEIKEALEKENADKLARAKRVHKRDNRSRTIVDTSVGLHKGEPAKLYVRFDTSIAKQLEGVLRPKVVTILGDSSDPEAMLDVLKNTGSWVLMLNSLFSKKSCNDLLREIGRGRDSGCDTDDMEFEDVIEDAKRRAVEEITESGTVQDTGKAIGNSGLNLEGDDASDSSSSARSLEDSDTGGGKISGEDNECTQEPSSGVKSPTDDPSFIKCSSVHISDMFAGPPKALDTQRLYVKGILNTVLAEYDDAIVDGNGNPLFPADAMGVFDKMTFDKYRGCDPSKKVSVFRGRTVLLTKQRSVRGENLHHLLVPSSVSTTYIRGVVYFVFVLEQWGLLEFLKHGDNKLSEFAAEIMKGVDYVRKGGPYDVNDTVQSFECLDPGHWYSKTSTSWSVEKGVCEFLLGGDVTDASDDSEEFTPIHVYATSTSLKLSEMLRSQSDLPVQIASGHRVLLVSVHRGHKFLSKTYFGDGGKCVRDFLLYDGAYLWATVDGRLVYYECVAFVYKSHEGFEIPCIKSVTVTKGYRRWLEMKNNTVRAFDECTAELLRTKATFLCYRKLDAPDDIEIALRTKTNIEVEEYIVWYITTLVPLWLLFVNLTLINSAGIPKSRRSTLDIATTAVGPTTRSKEGRACTAATDPSGLVFGSNIGGLGYVLDDVLLFLSSRDNIHLSLSVASLPDMNLIGRGADLLVGCILSRPWNTDWMGWVHKDVTFNPYEELVFVTMGVRRLVVFLGWCLDVQDLSRCQNYQLIIRCVCQHYVASKQCDETKVFAIVRHIPNIDKFSYEIATNPKVVSTEVIRSRPYTKKNLPTQAAAATPPVSTPSKRNSSNVDDEQMPVQSQAQSGGDRSKKATKKLGEQESKTAKKKLGEQDPRNGRNRCCTPGCKFPTHHKCHCGTYVCAMCSTKYGADEGIFRCVNHRVSNNVV